MFEKYWVISFLFTQLNFLHWKFVLASDTTGWAFFPIFYNKTKKTQNLKSSDIPLFNLHANQDVLIPSLPLKWNSDVHSYPSSTLWASQLPPFTRLRHAGLLSLIKHCPALDHDPALHFPSLWLEHTSLRPSHDWLNFIQASAPEKRHLWPFSLSSSFLHFVLIFLYPTTVLQFPVAFITLWNCLLYFIICVHGYSLLDFTNILT